MRFKFFKDVVVLIIVALLLCGKVVDGQEKNFEISLNYNYTTNARLFLFPLSADRILRNKYLDLEDIFSFSVGIGYKIADALQLRFNLEKISKTASDNSVLISLNGGAKQIEAEDGFSAYLLELNLIYTLPFSGNNFKLFFGGGVGSYWGRQIRNFNEAKLKSKNKEFAFGIQAIFGIEYYFYKNIAFKFEMLFREPEIKLHSQYENKLISYEGNKALILNDSFDTKIDINGAVFQFGFVYNF